MHNSIVHSNESACRKSGRIGLEQVLTNHNLTPNSNPTPKLNQHRHITKEEN